MHDMSTLHPTHPRHPASRTQNSAKSSDLLLARALHLVTLQLHCLKQQHQQSVGGVAKGGGRCGGDIDAQEGKGAVGGGGGGGGDGGGGGGGCSGGGVGYGHPAEGGGSQGPPFDVGEGWYFAVMSQTRGSRVANGGSRGRYSPATGGGGGQGGGSGSGSVCEMLGMVARDHAALGDLFENGLKVCARNT